MSTRNSVRDYDDQYFPRMAYEVESLRGLVFSGAHGNSRMSYSENGTLLFLQQTMFIIRITMTASASDRLMIEKTDLHLLPRATGSVQVCSDQRSIRPLRQAPRATSFSMSITTASTTIGHQTPVEELNDRKSSSTLIALNND